MSTVVGNSLPLERLKALAAHPGQARQQTIAILLTMLSDDEEVRAWASDALGEIEEVPVETATQLAELTRHVNPPLAGWACKLIGKLPEPSNHQSALAIALTQHPSISVRQLAALTLGSVHDLSQDTKAALQIAAANSDPRLSRLAKEALENG
jgi:HEAT repeats